MSDCDYEEKIEEACAMCGSKELKLDNFQDRFQVVCLNCQTSYTPVSSKNIAIAAWNRNNRFWARKNQTKRLHEL